MAGDVLPHPGGKSIFLAIEHRRALERRRALMGGEEGGEQNRASSKEDQDHDGSESDRNMEHQEKSRLIQVAASAPTPEAHTTALSTGADIHQASNTAGIPRSGPELPPSDHPPATLQPSPAAKKKIRSAQKKSAKGGEEPGSTGPMKKHTKRPKGSCVNCSLYKLRCDDNVPSCASCVKKGIPCMVGLLTKEEWEEKYAVPKGTWKRHRKKPLPPKPLLPTISTDLTAAPSTSELPQASPAPAAYGPSSAVQTTSTPGPSSALRRLPSPVPSARHSPLAHPVTRTIYSVQSTPNSWSFRSPGQSSSGYTSRSGWTSSRYVSPSLSPSPTGRRSASPSRNARPSLGRNEGRSDSEDTGDVLSDTPDEESDAADGVRRVLTFEA